MRFFARAPGEITICGHKIKFKYMTEGKENFGICDPDENTIEIYCRMITSEKLLHQTLVHEVFHMILAKSGINQILEEETEESIAHCLDQNLSGLIRFDRRKWKKVKLIEFGD